MTAPTLPWKAMDTATAVKQSGEDVMLADWVGLVLQGFWDGSNWRVRMTGLPAFEPVQWAPIPPMFENSL